MKESGSKHDWQFTYFGTSTSAEMNRMAAGGSLENGLTLSSCMVREDGTVGRKGGKFPAGEGYDGISFYYTRIEAREENFVLKADVTIDYINPAPDGQEGAALMVRDSLGEHGEAECAFFTNSAAVIGTKLNYVAPDGTITAVKDGIGYRMVTGAVSAVNPPDARVMKLDSQAFAPDVQLETGNTYTFELRKTNTGYHAASYGADGRKAEHTLYGPEKLLQIDKKYVYVGFAVARGCNASFHHITFTTSRAADDPAGIEKPIERVPLRIWVLSPSETGRGQYELAWKTNADGIMSIFTEDGLLLAEQMQVAANAFTKVSCPAAEGKQVYRLRFTPNREALSKERQMLSSGEPMEITHTVICRRFGSAVMYAAPGGSETGAGTSEAPLNISAALRFAVPGQTILLRAGIYELQEGLVIPRGVDGTAAEPIVLRPESGEVVLDFMRRGSGLELAGAHWELHGFGICRSADGTNGLVVSGNHNVVSQVKTYANGNTGLQISGDAAESREMWPSFNQIVNCCSYHNCDEAVEHADGFGAKLACGEGNVFTGCVSAYNADDGFDLFAKIALGSTGRVTIENCVAFKNGFIFDKDGNVREAGSGNGFKLGGSGLSGRHILRGCRAYDNRGRGIDSNSCPDIEIYDNISFNNRAANIGLYTANRAATAFKARGNISLRCGMKGVGERLELNGQDMDLVYNETNFYYDAGSDVSRSSSGAVADAGMFISLDTGVVPTRRADGSLDLHGLLERREDPVRMEQ